MATARTVQQMREQTPSSWYNRTARGSPVRWPTRSRWPSRSTRSTSSSRAFPCEVIETGHTDTVDTTALQVPDLGLIVSGDVAYNHCHMFVGATTAGQPGRMDRRPRQAGRAQSRRRRHRPQGPNPRQPALGPGRVPRLPRILRTAPRGGPARPGSVRRHGDPLSRLGQPSAIPDTRLTEPVAGDGRLERSSGVQVVGQDVVDLAAGADAELGEDFAQVVLDRPGADEQPGANLRVQQAVAGAEVGRTAILRVPRLQADEADPRARSARPPASRTHGLPDQPRLLPPPDICPVP